MSKSFDFNAITQQTLETKLKDVVLHVTTPPERLIEQLAATQEQMEAAKAKGEDKSIEMVRMSYEMAARLISCNLEEITVTADDLRDKYKIPPVALAAYLTVYMDFINEFHNAKN